MNTFNPPVGGQVPPAGGQVLNPEPVEG